jgi:hypothetical protein
MCMQRSVTSGGSYFESERRGKEIGYPKKEQVKEEIQSELNVANCGECNSTEKVWAKCERRRKTKGTKCPKLSNFSDI